MAEQPVADPHDHRHSAPDLGHAKRTLSGRLSAKQGTRTPSDYFLAALSPDGNLVAATDPEGATVHVWNTASGLRSASRDPGSLS